ncbi:MAG: hypothetical protein ACFCUQ_00470 [Kiloniellales bacterium]
MKSKLCTALAAAALVLSGLAASASANDYEPQIRAAFETKIKPWLSDPKVVEAIKAQNQKHVGLSEAEIDTLDKQWRAEAKAGGGPLIDEVMANALSSFLKSKKSEIGGLVTEMFVMDNLGLNVGQSDVTTDYMQGDEAKWQKTYPAGPGAVFVDDVEFDDSTESFQSQISVTIVDPATGEPIGAITVGVNVEELS